jgi:GNAT superfamily N-acetyltransferase
MTELARLRLAETTVVLRRAGAADVPAIVSLLADDRLGATRETVSSDLSQGYQQAFAAIDADPSHLLVVGVDGSRIVATMQLSFLPGLARGGAWRAQIEAVRVAGDFRGRRLGRLMFEWAISEARARGCALVQLTSDKQRRDAHRFYTELGFVASHEGFKLTL